MKPRILAIRGGAIGDFILTLPALRLLREAFPHCHLEVLGYRHIAALALHGGPEPGTTYADATRSIEYGPLAGFFARNGNLSPELCEYFASFQQVVSWLFDPDGIFETNVKRAGVKNYLSAYTPITDENHASTQLARGLESMALFLDDPAAKLIPTPESHQAAETWLSSSAIQNSSFTALHPGSGSPRKNWPLEKWRTLAGEIKDPLLIIGGEADTASLDSLAPHATLIARDLPLPTLAALLTRCTHYFGHDTGISHLAAAVGAKCTLLFGPTDPAVWAPQGAHVKILHTPDLYTLTPKDVLRN
jgi:heptosyltransferase-2